MKHPRFAACCFNHTTNGLRSFTLPHSLFVGKSGVSEDGEVRTGRYVAVVARDDDTLARLRVLPDVMATSVAYELEPGAT